MVVLQVRRFPATKKPIPFLKKFIRQPQSSTTERVQKQAKIIPLLAEAC